MAEEAAPNERLGARAPSRRDVLLDALFAVLNFILSGPPGWQKRPQQPTQQPKSNGRAELLWGASLGGILGIWQACVYYFGFENDTPNIFNSGDGWLVYPVTLALSFILITLLRGRMTGSFEDGLRITLIACLIQAFTAIILLVVFSLVFNFWDWDHYGIVFALFGYDDQAGSFGYVFEVILLLFIQVPWAILSAFIGWLIGSRFHHTRPRAEGGAER